MKTAIALGTFDGLHAGHRAVLEKTLGFFSIAVTFDIPPKSIITGEPQLLILPEERANRMKQLGVNQVEIQKFEEVRNIEAKEYLETLKQKYNPERIVCGFNYRFGKNAEGDTLLLAKFCEQNNIEFICVPPVLTSGVAISSTYIRNLVRDGEIQKANSLIYGGFSFGAAVLHGDARGRKLGFPTANQKYPEGMVSLKKGVYISNITIDGKAYKAITNIGIRPTYKTETITCESYIKDFSGDIYDKEVKISLLRFVREEQKFNSPEELKNAIANDVKLLD